MKCYNEEKQKEKEASQSMAKKRCLASPPSGQLTLQGSIQQVQPYRKDSTRYKAITRKLAEFVATGNVANRVVECQAFCELLLQLDRRYPVPSRTGLYLEMEALPVDLKGRVAAKLKDSRKVALCTDIWTRKGMTQSFLGITAHFFTKSDHRRRVATLAVKLLPSPHTAEFIEEAVTSVLCEWDIP